MQSYKVSDELLGFDIETFVKKHLKEDPARTTLKLKPNFKQPFDFKWLADMLAIFPKAQYKLPTFAGSFCWFTPKSFEQASGELSAFYKAKLCDGYSIADLCGGLGVDDYYFSRIFKKVVSVDADEELNKLVRHNFLKLGVTNIDRLNSTAERFVAESKQTFDWIYIDADRRVLPGKRAFRFEDCQPDILKILPALESRCKKILLKFSPMADLTYCMESLSSICEIHVVAVKNEVKELLFILDTTRKGNSARIIAVDIESENQIHTLTNENLVQNKPATYSSLGRFLVEPSHAIIKAGLSHAFAQYIGGQMLAVNSYLILCDEVNVTKPGRFFQIIEKQEYSQKGLKRYLKEKQITKANVSKRNFAWEVAQIRSVFALKDGGEDYLFFAQDANRQSLVFHCKPLFQAT